MKDMPGQTRSTSRECLVTWDSGEGLGQAEGIGAGSRRVRRGVLKQEADLERKRRGFHSVGSRQDPPREEREIAGRFIENVRKGDGLDVFTSPFRALAESCGFKVIREEEASDKNSVTSQAGSLVSDSGEVSYCDHARSHEGVRIQRRRDTPRVDIHVKRTLSFSEGESSSGGEIDDSPEISDGNLVLTRKSPVLGKATGESRGRDKSNQSKQCWPKEDAKVQKRYETSGEHQPRGICKTGHVIIKSDKYDQRPCGTDEKEAPVVSKRRSKDGEIEPRHKKGPLTCCVGEHDERQYNYSRNKAHDEWSCSPGESESTETYGTVRESLSPQEIEFRHAQDPATNYHQADKSHAHLTSPRQRSCSNFNESSNFVIRGGHISAKPTSLHHKISSDFMPKTSPSRMTDNNLEDKSDRRLNEHGRVASKVQPGGIKSSRPCQRDKSNEMKNSDKPKLYVADNVPDAEAKHQTEQKKSGGGSSFRISRVMACGVAGPSYGIIRYTDSNPEPDDLDNDSKRDVSTEQQLRGYPCEGRKQTGFPSLEGEGNMPQGSNEPARTEREGLRRRPIFRDTEETDRHDREEYGRICLEKYETKHGRTCRKKFEDNDLHNYQNGKRVIKRGHIQRKEYNTCDNDRDAVEKQVYTEILKVKALAAKDKKTHEEPKAINNDCLAYSQAINKNGLNVGHIRFECEEASKDKQTKQPSPEKNGNEKESPRPTSKRQGDLNVNPLSPAHTSTKGDAPGYIHHHDHGDDIADKNFDEDEPKIDPLPTSELNQTVLDSFNLTKRENSQEQITRAPAYGNTQQTEYQEQNQSFHRHVTCHCQQVPQVLNLQQTQLPETETIIKSYPSGQSETHNAPCRNQARTETHPCTFREALWKENTQHGAPFAATGRGCTYPQSFQATPKTAVDESSSAKKNKEIIGAELHDSTSKSSNTKPHLGEMQSLQHKPPRHHQDSGFNINFNYEGSDSGDNAVPGSRFIGQYFLELWKNQCLCDVRLRVGNWSYLAHKIVLAAFSDFFCPNDPHCMPSICFDIPNATPDAVHQILLYLYTSEMEITDYSLDSVLCAAESLGVSEVINLVKEILENPTPENFEHYMDIRSRHGFPGKLTDYTNLIREHLLDLTNSSHFLEIELDDLQHILGDPEVKVDSEVDIIDVIARWVEYNPMERIANSADLLKFVNFDCIPAECLADVVERKRHVFSREAFSIFLDAFKARSITAESLPCPPIQTIWPTGNSGPAGNGSISTLPLPRPTASNNMSTNADIYRPAHMMKNQQQIQQPVCYEFPETNITQNKTMSGANYQDNFRSPSKPRRENTRIPRSSQNKMTALLGRNNGSGWTSDAATILPSSTGMSSRQSSAPRRFATTQSTRMATPKEIMSMASRADCDQGATWSRSGIKHHRIGRFSGSGGGRRGGAGVYRCSNENAMFSPPCDGDGNCGDAVGGALPVPSMGAAPLWEESIPNTSQPTSPGRSRASGGSFVASPWMSPGYSMDSLPPGCSSYKITRGGRGPRWEQRSRSPSVGQGSRDRSSSKRVTFVR